jgi:phosphate transport system substrate-binding protein
MSDNQSQLITYAVIALILGAAVGFFAAGPLRYNSRINELEARVDELEQAPGDLSECIEELDAANDEIDDLEAEIADLEDTINEMQQPEELSGDLFISGSSTVFPIADLAAEEFTAMHTDVNIQVEGPGSGTGVRKASDGTADIGMASRFVKDSEHLNAPTLVTYGVAKDSVSVVINPSNTLAGELDLSVEQVNQIFTGEITNWSELGGANADINVYTREEGSGTRATFMDFTGIEEGEFADGASVQQGNSAMRAAVAGDPNGIAYISLGYVDASVSPAKIDGFEGTVENVLAGTYPFQRILWMFTLGKASPLEQAYLDYVMSPDGQEIVEEEGFIPIYPTN